MADTAQRLLEMVVQKYGLATDVQLSVSGELVLENSGQGLGHPSICGNGAFADDAEGTAPDASPGGANDAPAAADAEGETGDSEKLHGRWPGVELLVGDVRAEPGGAAAPPPPQQRLVGTLFITNKCAGFACNEPLQWEPVLARSIA
jgi:hypothetical protein